MQAFIFPGQGSQYSGMGKDLADNFSVAREVFEEADDALGMHLGALCFSGGEEDLRLTANTQPAILTTSIAALRVLQQEVGLAPDYTAGHSLGEYSALVAAGVMDFAAAVRTVRQRGTFMQEAVPDGKGAMAAVMGLDAAVLEQLCNEASEEDSVVAPANYNSPGQIVIAGETAAVHRALDAARDQGARRALALPVSAPFHSQLMRPAADRLREALADIRIHPFQCPVVSNVEARPYRETERVKELLIEQVCAPVRWDASVQAMQELGVNEYLEIGPGKVLAGLVKRIDRRARVRNLVDCADLAALTD